VPRILIALLVALLAAAPVAEAATKKKPSTREVLVVSNNWAGTADFIDTRTYKRVKRLNIIPDAQERIAELQSDPQDYGYYLAIRELVGEGNDQYVDDSFTSPDGRYLYVSRPSFVDVVAFDLRTDRIVWRAPVEGNRADHMAISKNGKRLLVSASTANKVHEIDTATGKITRSFESGDSPHENNYSNSGKTIFHASIGTVYTPTDEPSMDDTKGARYFQLVDNKTFKIRKRWDIGQKMEEAGYPDQSAAVRPMAISPDERFVYMQLSFLHGFAEFDLRKEKIRRVAQLPVRDPNQPREEYLLDSAHHGLSIDRAGKKLCVAGTMDGYAAIVSRKDFKKFTTIPVGEVPYWATNNGNGQVCFVSVAAEDKVAVISYKREKLVREIAVGDHPQRMRMGRIRNGFLGR
jgi:hypothetical protein